MFIKIICNLISTFGYSGYGGWMRFAGSQEKSRWNQFLFSSLLQVLYWEANRPALVCTFDAASNSHCFSRYVPR